MGGLFLIAACGLLVVHFFESIWTTSIDVALHYALVARLSEHWQLTTNNDPSLGEMNTYPRYAHRLGAIVGNLIGSPFSGMELVALISLTAVWSGFAFLFLALPRRMLWIASGAVVALLLVNRFFIHLELFGSELIGNYFFPQIVAQAIAVTLMAVVLWMERAAISPAVGYGILGCFVPILQQVHLLPAVEVLGTLAVLVALDALVAGKQNRRNVFLFGLFCIAAAIFFTVQSSAFGIMIVNASSGAMKLNYTPTFGALAIECIIVNVLSGRLIWVWQRLDSSQTRMNHLTFKYLGIFGMAVALMCLVQVVMFKFGYGSLYACQKFAFGVNTALVLELPLLFLPSLDARFPSISQPNGWQRAWLSRQMYPGLFVLVSVLSILPAPSSKIIALSDIVSVEHFIKEYGQPSSVSAKYDYGIGLFPGHRNFDYLITIGALKAPRVDNADDFINGRRPSKPRKIGRIFTRTGSTPWDIPGCRQVSQDGLVILDGQCVLSSMTITGARTGP
jgi:hypothetical protein